MSLYIFFLYFYFIGVDCQNSIRPDQNLWIWPTTFEDDGKPFAEFTCNAYLKARQWLTWYQTSPFEYKTTIQAEHDGYKTMNLLLPLDESADGKEIYCRTEQQQSHYWTKISESHKIKIDLHKRGMLLPKTVDPRVTPETFVDNGDPFVEFTCWARLNRHELLSWYQVKTGQLETTKIITSTQQDNHSGFVKILLQMKLEESDNNTIIYCVEETVTKKGILTDQKPSEKITIVFHRSTELWGNEHPWVTPETFKDDGQSVMEFTCHAYLNNADLLSWFQITGSNIPKRLAVIQQTYGSGYNKTKLMKVLEPSDNGTQIYCARETLTAGKRSEFRSPIIPILFQRALPECSSTVAPNIERHITASNPDAHNGTADQESCQYTPGHATVPWSVAGVMSISSLVLGILLIMCGKLNKRREHQLLLEIENLKASQTLYEEIKDRPTCALPSDSYDVVYEHGAGLLRRPQIK